MGLQPLRLSEIINNIETYRIYQSSLDCSFRTLAEIRAMYEAYLTHTQALSFLGYTENEIAQFNETLETAGAKEAIINKLMSAYPSQSEIDKNYANISGITLDNVDGINPYYWGNIKIDRIIFYNPETGNESTKLKWFTDKWSGNNKCVRNFWIPSEKIFKRRSKKYDGNPFMLKTESKEYVLYLPENMFNARTENGKIVADIKGYHNSAPYINATKTIVLGNAPAENGIVKTKKTDYFVEGIKFPKGNKNQTLEIYKNELATGDYRTERCKILKEVYLTNKKFIKVSNSLLSNHTDLFEKIGGGSSDAPEFDGMDYKTLMYILGDKTNPLRKLYFDTRYTGAVKVINTETKEVFYVNTEGYDYARYVGF